MLGIILRDHIEKCELCHLQALNDDGKKVTGRTVTVRGKKVPLTLCRMVLQFASPDSTWPVEPSELFTSPKQSAAGNNNNSNSSGAGSSKRGKAKKRKAAAQNNSAAESQAQNITLDDVIVEGAVKVFVEEISAVRGSAFDLKAIQDPIKNAGRYGTTSLLNCVSSVLCQVSSPPAIV